MLIEFRVKNFRSFQDEQVFSLVANSQKQHKNNTFKIENENLTLLKSVAIYGANAAGKSNLIAALMAMRTIVTKSAIVQRGEKLPILPFLLGNNKDKPTEFEVSFIAQDTRYRYGFSTTKNIVIKEWLYAYPNGRIQQWFSRIYDDKVSEYTYGDMRNLSGEKKLWEKSTRENALFLSTAIQLNSKQLKPIFDWFLGLNISRNFGEFGNSLDVTVGIFQKQPKEIIDYLKAVDLDIENLKVNEQEVNMEELPLNFPIAMKEIMRKSKKIKEIKIQTTHLNQQGKLINFDINLESNGTQKFFILLGPVLDTLHNGRVLVIDELHNQLHPAITRFIIELFHNNKINTKNAQLIFTTHETSVLNKDIFRKDQIYFCEKQNKATIIYSMSDFKGLRENIDYEKSYLLGRFGALPRLKSIKGLK